MSRTATALLAALALSAGPAFAQVPVGTTADTRPAAPQQRPGWTEGGIEAQVTGAMLRGNVDLLTANAAFNANYNLGANKFFLDAGNTFTRAGGATIVNRVAGSALYAYAVTDDLNLYGYSTHAIDPSIQLNYRLTTGAGVCRHQLLQPWFSLLLLSVNPAFEQEWFQDGTSAQAVRGVGRLTAAKPLSEDLEVGGDLNATVLRFPRDGKGQEDLEVVSRGNRNAYDVVFAPVPVDLAAPDGATAWQLFASENGPDFNDAPDEVNHVRWGLDFGFPDQFGMVTDPAAEGKPYSSPVYPALAHTSADGIAYISNPAWPLEYRTLYVTLFGEVFSPLPVGHIVERVALTAVEADGGVTYRGEPSEFVGGMDRPLPLVAAPDGNLVVGDYATGLIYRISYAGGE